MAETPWLDAVSWHLSTSTFRNMALGYLAGNNSNCGAIRWQGPHLKKINVYKAVEVAFLWHLPSGCKVYDHQTYTSSSQFSLEMCFIINNAYRHFLFTIYFLQLAATVEICNNFSYFHKINFRMTSKQGKFI